jgi:hypothetical protein
MATSALLHALSSRTSRAALQEALLSHDDQRRLIRQAIDATVAGPGSPTSLWVRDVYDNFVIVEDEADAGALYSYPYTIDPASNAVTLGARTKVAMQVTYVPVATGASEGAAGGDRPGVHLLEAGPAALLERAVRSDSTFPVKIIAPGWGTSGYYPAEVLERDGPKVFPKGLKMFWNHATAQEKQARPEGDLRYLAGELVSDGRWEPDNPQGPGLYAEAKALQGYKEAVNELAPHIGISIDAWGNYEMGTAEGREGRIITELLAAESVDFVTQAGAGGQVLELFESYRRSVDTDREGGEVTEQEAQALREANTRLSEELAREREGRLLIEGRQLVAATLASIDGLPDATRARLSESLASRAVIADGKLDREATVTAVQEAAKGELDYLAGLGLGSVRGMGGAPESNTGDAAAKLEEAFKGLGYSEASAKVAARGR